MTETELYFREYLSIKFHFKKKEFFYGIDKINTKYVKKYQYLKITKYAKYLTIHAFKRYMMINFFFDKNFDIYNDKQDYSYVNPYYIYHSNVDYYFKKDVCHIKKNCDKIDYDNLYNLYEKNEIFFFTIVDIYKKYREKLKFKNREDKYRLDKYIYLDDKLKQEKKIK